MLDNFKSSRRSDLQLLTYRSHRVDGVGIVRRDAKPPIQEHLLLGTAQGFSRHAQRSVSGLDDVHRAVAYLIVPSHGAVPPQSKAVNILHD